MPIRPPATSLVISLFILSLNWPASAQLDRSSLGAARRYVEKIPARTEQIALPSNLHVTRAYRELVEPFDSSGTLAAYSSRHPVDATDKGNDFDLFVKSKK